MGSAMAWELTAEGKAGVVINGVYDAWTPARAYQHYHGGIRILSETASCRIASPTTVPFERLSPQIGVNPKVRSWNFPLVWPGGEWKLANIVDYMQSGAFALLRNASHYRERWLRDFYRIGKDAMRERKPGEPFAFLIPPMRYDRFLNDEERKKVAVVSEELQKRAAAALTSRDPKAMTAEMEKLQQERQEKLGSIMERFDVWGPEGKKRLLAILNRGDVEVLNTETDFEADGKTYPKGTRIILMQQPYGAFAKTLLERQQYPDLREYPGGPPRRPYDVTAHTLSLLMGVNVVQVNKPFDVPHPPTDSAIDLLTTTLRAPFQARLGMYQSFAASMDEGWTRWIFDQYETRYVSLRDGDIRAGNLRAKFDAIIIPAQSAQQLFNGLPRDRYPAEVAGGLGTSGVDGLKKFVEEGGTIITLNEASQFAINYLGVPVKNVLEGIPAKDFYCPGSILKIKFDAASPLTAQAPTLDATSDESIAWFETGPAFATTSDEAKVIARFADAKDVLLSGWLLGAEKIAGKGAIVEVKRGRGRIVMFAFRPQYRGQSIATLPFLFNAISTSATAH
jgi:hypothetical protein